MQVFVLRKLSKQTIMGLVLLKCLLYYWGTHNVGLFRGRPTSLPIVQEEVDIEM